MCTHYTQVTPEARAEASAQHPQTPALTWPCRTATQLENCSVITIIFSFDLVLFKVRLLG